MEGIHTDYAEVLLMIMLEIFRLDPQKYQDTTEQSRKIVALSRMAEKSHSGMYILAKKGQKKKANTHMPNNN